MFNGPSGSWGYASPALRDCFLRALDRRDTAAARKWGLDLRACTVNLPGETCISLGLAHGSTYADAASLILGSVWSPR